MKRIQVYSCQKYDETGDGRVMLEVKIKDRDPKEVKDEIKKLRDQYKTANIVYRKNNKPKSN